MNHISKRKDTDYTDQLLLLINNKPHPRTAKLFPRQKEVIQFLRQNKKKATMKEIQKLLNLEFQKHQKGTREYRTLSSRYYRILTPLFGWAIDNTQGNIYRLTDLLSNKRIGALKRHSKYLLGGEQNE